MGRLRWTEHSIREIARNFTTRTELAKSHRGAYRRALEIDGLLDELYGNQKFVWKKGTLVIEASKYKTKSEFISGNAGAYVTCVSRFPGLIDELFDNQLRCWKTEESVVEEARKFKNRSEFMRNSSGAYKSATSKFPHIFEHVFGDSLTTPWELHELISEASEYKSRSLFQAGSAGAYAAFLRFPEELDKIFPPKYRYWDNEDSIRAEASKYRTKSEFICGCVGAYGAALAMGIIDDLGFEPGYSGFDTTAPAYLYVTKLNLLDGKDGVMFGVTNRTPNIRYTGIERKHMYDSHAYLFATGAEAIGLETILRREFIDHAVAKGQSPLRDKQGTAGEILSDVPLHLVISMISEHCSNLPEQEAWC